MAIAAIPSGFFAGLGSAMLYPSKSLAIYIFWKTLEVHVGLRLTNGNQIKYIGYLYISIEFKVGLNKI